MIKHSIIHIVCDYITIMKVKTSNLACYIIIVYAKHLHTCDSVRTYHKRSYFLSRGWVKFKHRLTGNVHFSQDYLTNYGWCLKSRKLYKIFAKYVQLWNGLYTLSQEWAKSIKQKWGWGGAGNKTRIWMLKKELISKGGQTLPLAPENSDLRSRWKKNTFWQKSYKIQKN